jgi:hypothetical protein
MQYHQRVVEERNPYKFIEKTLGEARQRLEKMKDTPKLIETITDVCPYYISLYRRLRKRSFSRQRTNS